VDVYENEGKRSGAYSHGTKGTKPFILMNYGNNVDGVFTLAHEAGHSMHTLLSSRNQEYVNADYSIFVAEVASTANEALLQRYLMEKGRGGSVDEQIYLLDRFLKDMMGTVIRQTMFADFELRIHEMAERGETLTPESMGSLYSSLVAKYYGPDMTIDPETAYTWARIPHFFYNYYVYQYATSYAASYAVAERILGGDPGAAERFLALLSEGGSDYPIEQLKRAGVDMTEPAPVESAMRAFENAVVRLEKLIEAS
jgi:oligoendopeptidase F